MTQGQVVILNRDFAGTAGLRARLTEFEETECAYGIIIGTGKTCSSCICERSGG